MVNLGSLILTEFSLRTETEKNILIHLSPNYTYPTF